MKDDKRPLRGLYPPRGSLNELLVTPPSHFTPQKAKGQYDGFTGNGGATTTQKNTLMGLGSQGKMQRNLPIAK
jgi:hypothetical protein